MKPIVAVVNSNSFGVVIPEHLQQLTEMAEVLRFSVPNDLPPLEFAAKLQDADAIIASVTPRYPAELLNVLPRLKLIARHGIGCDNVDVAAASACGIIVTRVPGLVEQAGVAEHALALMLAASRHIPAASAGVRRGEWQRRAEWTGGELSGKTVGIIGIGNIGTGLARILSGGFHARVLAYDPFLSAAQVAARHAQQVELGELLEHSAFVSLHCSLNPTSRGLIDRSALAALQPGTVLVNTARGECVDEEAVLAALADGRLACYAADVVTGEPIDQKHRLLSHPNALIVPHLGGYTYDSLRGMGDTMLRNVREVLLDGTVPANAVNPECPVRSMP